MEEAASGLGLSMSVSNSYLIGQASLTTPTVSWPPHPTIKPPCGCCVLLSGADSPPVRVCVCSTCDTVCSCAAWPFSHGPITCPSLSIPTGVFAVQLFYSSQPLVCACVCMCVFCFLCCLVEGLFCGTTAVFVLFFCVF